MNRTLKYARDVLSGDIIAGEYVRLSCERFMSDLKKSKTKAFPFKFDVEIAESVFDFFLILRHSKGEFAGKPIELALWQCFISGNIYGWVHKKTGLRRYATGYIQVAKKNGKSTKLAGLGIYGLVGDGEEGAEVYCAATKKDQARIIFDEALRMIKSSPDLRKYLDVFRNNISMPSTNSKFEPLSADADTLDGLNISMGIIDEPHAHKTRDVYDIVENGTSSRLQPLIISITTAGFNQFGIAKELYDYSVRILKGIITDDTFFPYIAQLDEDDDWTDETCWIKANPNLGVSVYIDDLRRKLEKAKNIPAAQENFKCKHLNIWTNAEKRWMDMDKWKACLIKIISFSKRDCYCGVDLSTTIDLTSVTFEFPLEDGYYAYISHSFMPEDRVDEATKRDGVPYRVWINQGFITETPGAVIDYEWIKSYIIKKSEVFNILEICIDPWNATQFGNDMDAEGFTVVDIRQGFATLSEPTKDIEKLVYEQKIIHYNNPVLTWAVNNAVARFDPAGNIKLDKSKSKFRIDPIISLVTAHVRGITYKHREDPSEVYKDRGMVIL